MLVGKTIIFETPFELEGKNLVLKFRLPKTQIWSDLLAQYPTADEITEVQDGKEVKLWKSRDYTEGDDTKRNCGWALKTKELIREKLKEYWIDDNKISFDTFVDEIWASDTVLAINMMNEMREKYASSFHELGKSS